MKVDQTYDSFGRLLFASDPYPSTQDARTAYGTTQYFNADGTPSCSIRGNGKQAFTDATDEANEVYPSCVYRRFQDNLQWVNVRDSSSLLVSSPQNGVVRGSAFTPTGRLITRSTWQGTTRLEHAVFGHDRLGRQTSMTRYQDPVNYDKPVKWTWHFDSLGQLLELDEPENPAQFNTYSDWGELLDTKRTVNGTVKRVVQKYDALGRLVHGEQQTGGIVDPETVHDYAYDAAMQVAPQVVATNVLGRLAQATWPTGSVTYSYDGLGRNNAMVFTDARGGNYVEKHTFHGDGSLDVLDLFLPDTVFADEQIKYTFDSAGRGRTVKYINGADQRELYKATEIDPFGRVRAAKYALADYTATYADLGRRLMTQVAVSAPADSRKISYGGFDPVGRERSRTELRGGFGTSTGTNWTYDALGRLTKGEKTRGAATLLNQAFTYDPLGNLSTTTSTGTEGGINTTLSYSTTDRDRICRITFGSSSDTACNVTYDELGSIFSQPTPTGTRDYTYLVDGSVRKITDSQGNSALFHYDAFGQVQQLDTGGGSTDARQDRHYGSLITLRQERIGSSPPQAVFTRKIPLHDGSVATRHGAGDVWTFEYGEQRGNRFFTDQSGAFVQEIEYQPFGKPTSTIAQPGSQLYSSKQRNFGDSLAALGISQLGARLYDPAIGRFTSRDPLLITHGGTTSNPYAFAANDPVNLSDPSGLLPPCRTGDPFCITISTIATPSGPPPPEQPPVDFGGFESQGGQVDSSDDPWNGSPLNAGTRDGHGTRLAAAFASGNVNAVHQVMLEAMFPPNGVAAAASQFARGVAADGVQAGGTVAGGILGAGGGTVVFGGPWGAPTGAAIGAGLGAGIAYPFAQWIRGETPTLSGQLAVAAFGATLETGGRVVGSLLSRLLSTAVGPSSMVGSIRNANPTRGMTNCVNCAIATDATLAGNPASALPGGSTPASELSRFFGQRWWPVTGIKSIEFMMTAYGPGSRGIVWGIRAGNTAGHVFNVMNQGGVIRFLDGQIGGQAALTGYANFYLLLTHH